MTPFYRSPSEIIRVNAGSNTNTDRLLELKLMHHFTALTAQTLSDGEDQQFAWRVDIPAIAYEAQYLMDAILAVSALHLRALNPNDASIVRASHSYIASSIGQYSALLSNGVSSLNAEALFATAALIAFQTSASRYVAGKGTPYSIPLAWFHAFQGVKTVVMTSWQWLRSSQKIFPIINGQPALALDPDPQRRLFFSSLLIGLEDDLEATPEMLRASTKQAYEHAVSFLNWAHVQPVRARILGFAAAVSRRFVDLMRQHEPRALVIVACFFALTKKVDDVWWLDGIAATEVNGIYSLLPPEWWPKMEWALMIANHVGAIDDYMWGVYIDEETKKIEEMAAPVHSHIDMLAQLFANSELPD
jgi:hypothetical protein